jgi:hypothetical protein
MARSTGTDGLACQHRDWRWADFQLCRMEGGSGYGLVMPCELSDHWLVPDAATPGRHRVDLQPHAWPSSTAAIGARDARRAQEGQR